MTAAVPLTRTRALALVSSGAVDEAYAIDSEDQKGFTLMLEVGGSAQPIHSKSGQVRVFRSADALINYAREMGLETVEFRLN